MFTLFVAIVGMLPAARTSGAGTVAIDFQNPATLYTTTARGVFKSVDSGKTWMTKNTGFPVGERLLYINTFVIDPLNPKILYAATQDAGVFRSTDGANTWVQTNGSLTPITALAVDPAAPAALYAAAGLGTSVSATRVDHGGRIYKSTDGGITWRASSTDVTDPLISTVAIAPSKPNMVYAVTTLSGVVRSADAGATWHKAGTGISSESITALAIDPRSPNTLYAGTADRGVFKSLECPAPCARASSPRVSS